MKRITTFLTIVILFAVGVVISLKAADAEASHEVKITVKEVVLLRLNNEDAIEFTVDVKGGEEGIPGDEIEVASLTETERTKYLQYTSIVPTGYDAEKKITVAIKDLTGKGLPEGVQLTVSPMELTLGGGKASTFYQDPIDLSALPYSDGSETSDSVQVIGGIGTSWTGIEATDGLELLYDLVLPQDDDYKIEDIKADEYSVEVIYTLTSSY